MNAVLCRTISHGDIVCGEFCKQGFKGGVFWVFPQEPEIVFWLSMVQQCKHTHISLGGGGEKGFTSHLRDISGPVTSTADTEPRHINLLLYILNVGKTDKIES